MKNTQINSFLYQFSEFQAPSEHMKNDVDMRVRGEGGLKAALSPGSHIFLMRGRKTPIVSNTRSKIFSAQRNGFMSK